MGVGEQDAKHRGCVQMIEVVTRQQLAEPPVNVGVLTGHVVQVVRGLLGNALESGGKQLRFGAEILKDHRLGDTHLRGDVGHARLLVPDCGEDRDGSIEDGCAASGGGQAPASRSRGTLAVDVERLSAHARQFRLGQPEVIVDSDLSKD